MNPLPTTPKRPILHQRQRAVAITGAALGVIVLVAGGVWHLSPSFQPVESHRAQVSDKGMVLNLGSIEVASPAGEIKPGQVVALSAARGFNRGEGTPHWRSRAFDLEVPASDNSPGVLVKAHPIRAEISAAPGNGRVLLLKLPSRNSPTSYVVEAARVDKDVQARAVESGRYQFISVRADQDWTATATVAKQCTTSVANWANARLETHARGSLESCVQARDGALEVQVRNTGDYYVAREKTELPGLTGHELPAESRQSKRVADFLAKESKGDVEVIAPGERRTYRFEPKGWADTMLTFRAYKNDVPADIALLGWRQALTSPPFSLDDEQLNRFTGCVSGKLTSGQSPTDLRSGPGRADRSGYADCLETVVGSLNDVERGELAIREYFVPAARKADAVHGAVARAYIGKPESLGTAAAAMMTLSRDGKILIQWPHLKNKTFRAKRVDVRRYLGQDEEVTPVPKACRRDGGPTHQIQWRDLTVYSVDQKIVGWHLRENVDGKPGVAPKSLKVAALLDSVRGPALSFGKPFTQLTKSYPSWTPASTDSQDHLRIDEAGVSLFVAGTGVKAQITGAASGQTC